MTPFTIKTPDFQTLYAWHVLPVDAYIRNAESLSAVERPQGPVEDFTKTLPFELLSSTSTPARVVINCELPLHLIIPLETLLTTPRRRSPWQRWSCRPRLANRYLPQPGPATQHPCSDHRLSRLRTFHRFSHRSRSDCGRYLSRQLGSKNSQNPTGEHCHPRPKSRNSSLKRCCAKLHRPIKQSDPR